MDADELMELVNRREYYDNQGRKAWANIRCHVIFWAIVTIIVTIVLAILYIIGAMSAGKC